MKKRIKRISLIVCIAIVLSTFVVPTVSAAGDMKTVKVLKGTDYSESIEELSGNSENPDSDASYPTFEDCESVGSQKIYFEYPTDGTWGDFNNVKINSKTKASNVFCYAYAVYGNTVTYLDFGFETNACRCYHEYDNVFSYDLNGSSKINLDEIDPETGKTKTQTLYRYIENNPEADYCVLFSTTANGGFRTCSLNMSFDCIGDTVVLNTPLQTREISPNSNTTEYFAHWKDNTGLDVSAYIDSFGYFQDGQLPIHQPRAQILSNALKNYLTNYSTFGYFNSPEKNAELCRKIGTTPEEVYSQYLNDNTEYLFDPTIISGKSVAQNIADDSPVDFIWYSGLDSYSRPKQKKLPSLAAIRAALGLSDSFSVIANSNFFPKNINTYYDISQFEDENGEVYISVEYKMCAFAKYLIGVRLEELTWDNRVLEFKEEYNKLGTGRMAKVTIFPFAYSQGLRADDINTFGDNNSGRVNGQFSSTLPAAYGYEEDGSAVTVIRATFRVVDKNAEITIINCNIDSLSLDDELSRNPYQKYFPIYNHTINPNEYRIAEYSTEFIPKGNSVCYPVEIPKILEPTEPTTEESTSEPPSVEPTTIETTTIEPTTIEPTNEPPIWEEPTEPPYWEEPTTESPYWEEPTTFPWYEEPTTLPPTDQTDYKVIDSWQSSYYKYHDSDTDPQFGQIELIYAEYRFSPNINRDYFVYTDYGSSDIYIYDGRTSIGESTVLADGNNVCSAYLESGKTYTIYCCSEDQTVYLACLTDGSQFNDEIPFGYIIVDEFSADEEESFLYQVDTEGDYYFFCEEGYAPDMEVSDNGEVIGDYIDTMDGYDLYKVHLKANRDYEITVFETLDIVYVLKEVEEENDITDKENVVWFHNNNPQWSEYDGIAIYIDGYTSWGNKNAVMTRYKETDYWYYDLDRYHISFDDCYPKCCFIGLNGNAWYASTNNLICAPVVFGMEHAAELTGETEPNQADPSKIVFTARWKNYTSDTGKPEPLRYWIKREGNGLYLDIDSVNWDASDEFVYQIYSPNGRYIYEDYAVTFYDESIIFADLCEIELNEGENYTIVFVDTYTDSETYPLLFNESCLGDFSYGASERIESPLSKNLAEVVYWVNENVSKFGPYPSIKPAKSNAEIVADYLIKHYDNPAMNSNNQINALLNEMNVTKDEVMEVLYSQNLDYNVFRTIERILAECDDPSSVAMIGDTNLDGRITISDVTAIQRHLAELEIFTEEQLALADTNGDGEINIADATHVQKYLAEFDGIVLGKQPTA